MKNHNISPTSSNEADADFAAWTAEYTSDSSVENFESIDPREPASPNQSVETQTDRVATIVRMESISADGQVSQLDAPTQLEAEYAAETGRQMPEASNDDDEADEQKVGYSSRSSKGIVKVADGINKLTGGLDSLANSIDDRGGLKKFSKALLGRIGRSVQSRIIKRAESFGDFVDNTIDRSTEKVTAVAKETAAKAQERWDARAAKRAAAEAKKEQNKAFDTYEENLGYGDAYDEATAIQATKQEQEVAYDSYAENIDTTINREAHEDYIDDLHEEALEDNEAFDEAELEKEAQKNAKLKARAAKIAKIRRRQKIESVVNKGADRVIAGKDRTVRAGRAVARFARGAKAYAAGVHAAGMNGVRTDTAIRNEKQSDYELSA